VARPDDAKARARAAARQALRRAGLQPAARTSEEVARLEAREAKTAAALAKVTAQRDQLTELVDAQAAEIDRLHTVGDVATGRDRTDLGYLFVVTYGRSGSTLLQGILSSIPGVAIRGENGAVLHDLFRYHDTATRHRDRLARPHPLPTSHPWWGIDGYRDETALHDMRLLVLETLLRPAPDTRVTGFKEIYWMAERMPDFLAFMQGVFPGARFVYNSRDLDEVARSKWHARNPNARTELETIERQYADALAPLGDRVYRVHYNDWVSDPTRLRGLFDWLGEAFDEARVREVMTVRHSY
jgi:hypothetical protein